MIRVTTVNDVDEYTFIQPSVEKGFMDCIRADGEVFIRPLPVIIKIEKQVKDLTKQEIYEYVMTKYYTYEYVMANHNTVDTYVRYIDVMADCVLIGYDKNDIVLNNDDYVDVTNLYKSEKKGDKEDE